MLQWLRQRGIDGLEYQLCFRALGKRRERQNPSPLAQRKWFPVPGKQIFLATWSPDKRGWARGSHDDISSSLEDNYFVVHSKGEKMLQLTKTFPPKCQKKTSHKKTGWSGWNRYSFMFVLYIVDNFFCRTRINFKIVNEQIIITLVRHRQRKEIWASKMNPGRVNLGCCLPLEQAENIFVIALWSDSYFFSVFHSPHQHAQAGNRRLDTHTHTHTHTHKEKTDRGNKTLKGIQRFQRAFPSILPTEGGSPNLPLIQPEVTKSPPPPSLSCPAGATHLRSADSWGSWSHFTSSFTWLLLLLVLSSICGPFRRSRSWSWAEGGQGIPEIQ